MLMMPMEKASLVLMDEALVHISVSKEKSMLKWEHSVKPLVLSEVLLQEVRILLTMRIINHGHGFFLVHIRQLLPERRLLQLMSLKQNQNMSEIYGITLSISKKNLNQWGLTQETVRHLSHL